MRAVRFAGSGGVEVIEITEVVKPQAVADKVLVRVRAAGINRADVLQRKGNYPAPPGALSDVPGLEFAGEVVEVGDEVQRWKAGQRVFGITGGGAQSEYIVAPENHLAEIPANLNYTEAASVPEAFITAHDALTTNGHIRTGEYVCVHAVASGVGLAALQIAKSAGAFVIGTSRTAEKLERAREYGLDWSAATNGDGALVFINAVNTFTGNHGVDLIIDLVGASLFKANLEALRSRGRIVLIGTLGGAHAELDWRAVMSKRARLIGTVLRSRSGEEKATAMRLFEREVVPLLANGKLRTVVDSYFKFEDVKQAHKLVESNATFGKVVLTFE